MEVRLFTEDDLDRVYETQQAAFKPLYDKYSDSISPYLETKETVLAKYRRDTGYVFLKDGIIAGIVRIIRDREDPKIGFISGLAVHPDYQGQGIAAQALLEIERRHNEFKIWKLDTILEEKGNCHLYEKLGYHDTGKREAVNERMTLIFYSKGEK